MRVIVIRRNLAISIHVPRMGGRPVDGLMRVLRGRETGKVAPPVTNCAPPMSPEDAERAKRHIAAIRKQMGWN